MIYIYTVYKTSFLGHGVNIASPLPSDQIDWTPPGRQWEAPGGLWASLAAERAASGGWAGLQGLVHIYPRNFGARHRMGVGYDGYDGYRGYDGYDGYDGYGLPMVARRFGCLSLFAHNKMRWTTGFGVYPIFWQAGLATEFTAAGIRLSEEKMSRDDSEWHQALHMEGIWNEMPKYCKSQNYWIHKLISIGTCIWWLTFSFVQKQCTIPEPVKVLKGTHRAAGKARCFLGSAGAWGWAWCCKML